MASLATDEHKWTSIAIHSVVEAAGATIAIQLGYYLLLGQKEDSVWFFPFLALGFIGMGILDFFHAMTTPGHSFIFLHSIAGIAGGLGFASVLLPKETQKKGSNRLIIALSLLAACFFGIWSLLYANTLPEMASGGSFTNSAIVLNMVQAILFLLPLPWFYKHRDGLGATRTYSFISIGFLFSLAGFTFGFSYLWSNGWWTWHLLRFLAYVVAIYVIAHAHEELHLEVQRDKVALAKSNQELDAFAYTASHDLKEPLRGIHNYAQFVLEDYGDVIDDDGKAKLETMCRLSNRMDGLIDCLLRFSRLGRQELELGEVSSTVIVSGAIDSLSTAIKENEAQIEVADNLPTITCDKVLLTQVFQNLIANSMKYNEKKPLIQIGWNKDKDNPIFHVRDNGIGIREKHLASVFKIFKRLNSRKKYGDGLGAGLTITQKIIERHGGTIWLESTYGEGTTFFFTISRKLEK